MDNGIMVTEEELKIFEDKISTIKIIANDKEVRKICNELLEVVKQKQSLNKKNVSEMIHDRMKELKYSDPEISADLYILYRKLVDGKISEEEALIQMGNYTSGGMMYYNKKIY